MTVENTLNLRESVNFESLIVVSQYFHVTRAKMLFKRRGITEISSVSPKYYEGRDMYSLIREFFAYYLN
jgi:vancomycin permeability regulator SanA